MNIVISFCITVYNQQKLVKECIDSIIQYQGNDIEIIISDDKSTENLKGLIDSYNDSRIKYYCNDVNLGHDRNIISALSHSSGNYAFLLRSRDRVITEAIPLLVSAAIEKDASYITGAALNQNGESKISYSKTRFPKGKETLEANYSLFVHPSGNMYKMSDLDLEQISDFLEDEQIPKWGFIVHSLIRLKLATTGDFKLITEPVWIYTDTEEAKDIAVNRSPNGLNVYDPSYIEQRYQYEIDWAKRVIDKDDYYYVFKLIAETYLDLVTWGFKFSNSDKRTQVHYAYEEKEFSVREERKKFLSLCCESFEEDMGISKKTFLADINKMAFKNMTMDAAKYIVRKSTSGKPAYNKIARVYKKVFKRL